MRSVKICVIRRAISTQSRANFVINESRSKVYFELTVFEPLAIKYAECQQNIDKNRKRKNQRDLCYLCEIK